MTKLVRISLDKAELGVLISTYTSSQIGKAMEYLTILLCGCKVSKKSANRFDSLPEELKIFMDDKLLTSKQNLTRWKKENDRRSNQE